MKSIFITGGSTGIGLELAKQYATDNYVVGICGRDASKLPANLSAEYPTIHFYTVDVINKASLQTAVNQFLQLTDGKLDIIIANAGRSTGSKIQLPDFDVLENIVATNFLGVINTFACAMPLFLQQGYGHLVAIASVAGFLGLPGAAAYSSSKAAVLTLCESFAIDLPKYGIDVTAIAPGFIDTPLTQQNDHHMPFLMPADQAAQKIKQAITKKYPLYIFPWQIRILITIARVLPRSVYRWLMRFPALNYSRGL